MNDNFRKIQEMSNRTQLAAMSQYQNVAAVANVYTIDMANQVEKNVSIETLDGVAKSIALANVPASGNSILTVTVRLKFTNNAAITYFAGLTWQNGNIPSFTVGKKYILSFMSYDNGVSWKGFSAGAW